VEAQNGAIEGHGGAKKGSVEAKNGAVRRAWRPVVAGSLHFNYEQDPDLDPHKKLKVRSGSASKRKVGSDPHKKVKKDPDQHSHKRDADPQHCLLFPVRILNTAEVHCCEKDDFTIHLGKTERTEVHRKYTHARGEKKEGRKSYQAAQGGWDPCTADTGTSHTSEQRPRHTAH
jgi:hypothetical protein